MACAGGECEEIDSPFAGKTVVTGSLSQFLAMMPKRVWWRWGRKWRAACRRKPTW
jgi:hypothetical protein